MTIGTRLFTWAKGTQVGTDRYGNRYFVEKSPRKGRKVRRWVLYKGIPEASKVPPEWHSWLHYTTDAPIPDTAAAAKPWIKEHIPNLTGTPAAYQPPGKDGWEGAATPAYEPWRPT